MSTPLVPVQILTYVGLRDFIQAKADAATGLPDFLIDPGPVSDDREKLNNDAVVFLSVGGGAGLELEYTYDRPFITAYVVGPQGDYDAAEALALWLDCTLLGVEIPTMVGQSRVLSVQRSGGRPELLMLDTATRYHFTCSYIAESRSGL